MTNSWQENDRDMRAGCRFVLETTMSRDRRWKIMRRIGAAWFAVTTIGFIGLVWVSWNAQQNLESSHHQLAVEVHETCLRTLDVSRAQLASSREQRARDVVARRYAQADGRADLIAAIDATTTQRDRSDKAVQNIIRNGCQTPMEAP